MKKTGGPFICCWIYNGVVAYFFGVYWLNNPDQIIGNHSYVCYANPDATGTQQNYWTGLSSISPARNSGYSINVTDNFVLWF